MTEKEKAEASYLFNANYSPEIDAITACCGRLPRRTSGTIPSARRIFDLRHGGAGEKALVLCAQMRYNKMTQQHGARRRAAGRMRYG